MSTKLNGSTVKRRTSWNRSVGITKRLESLVCSLVGCHDQKFLLPFHRTIQILDRCRVRASIYKYFRKIRLRFTDYFPIPKAANITRKAGNEFFPGGSSLFALRREYVSTGIDFTRIPLPRRTKSLNPSTRYPQLTSRPKSNFAERALVAIRGDSIYAHRYLSSDQLSWRNLERIPFKIALSCRDQW